MNRKWRFGRPKNVENFGGASIDKESVIDKVRESKHEEEKAKGFNMHVCWVNSKLMEYL